MFTDRSEAGLRLAELVAELDLSKPVVYALPRGGVPVAVEIARRLRAPLDLVVVRKIGAPGWPELALGAVVDGPDPQTVINPEVFRATGSDSRGFERARTRELAEIERRRGRYLGDRPPIDPDGRVAVIVDDGLATGATSRAALASLLRKGAARVVIAAPVAPAELIAELGELGIEVVVLHAPAEFWAIGQFYADFHQLSDDETIEQLHRYWAESEAGAP